MKISNGVNNILILNPPFIFKGNLSLKWKISSRIFWILSILSIAALLVFYIFQVNAEVSERYLIQKYGKRLAELSIESKNLEISSSQFNSLDNIIVSLEDLNFEKTNKTHYIRVLNNQVVAK